MKNTFGGVSSFVSTRACLSKRVVCVHVFSRREGNESIIIFNIGTCASVECIVIRITIYNNQRGVKQDSNMR